MARDRYLYFEPQRVARLRNLNLLARQAVDGFITGLHRSPHKGFSVEFSEHREYTPGDDLRHLDWVAWGRTDRYYIKQYEQETNLRATILLDVSASMGYRYSGESTKLTYGCFLSACLAYLMARQQDAAGMIAFDSDVRFHLPPSSTPAHLDRLFKQLERTRPGRTTAIGQTFHKLADSIHKRGLVVIISDLYDDPDEIVRALQHFVYKKHQVIVFHLLDEAEIEFPFRQITSFVDMETNERVQVDPRTVGDAYREEIVAFINRYRRECSDRNIEYIQATTTTPYDRMLMDYLARRKRATR
ncbi:MAG: DUF58 domain-containing protein [Planctomycetes bacterium]|jgi:uncharacterized protein (DUF58 family)|nr:DUF58 domain-containing protein [Phycisphaerae bacterium]NBB94880.1 DUF58 domain-containing protein [Planctomycetota bacterium]